MKYLKSANVAGTFYFLALATIVTPVATANESGMYLGANLGRSTTTIDDERITRALTGAGFTVNSFDEDRHDTGFKLFGGYQFNNYFAIEGGYFDLGESGFTATTSPEGTLTGRSTLEGVNLDFVGTLPLSQHLSAFGRVGANHAKADTTFSSTGAVSPPDGGEKRSTDYKYGLGLQYDFTKYFGMRLEAERYRFDDAVGNKGDSDFYSLGMIVRFGGQDQPPTMAAEPAPVAPDPTPAPVAVVIPAPAPTKVTLSADLLFDFDQATVKPSGQRELDNLAAELRNSDIDVITVTGHSDWIGTHAYNMSLSTQRAEAVKAYLVASTGISAAKILTRGTNGSDPVTRPGQCDDTRPTKTAKASQALIACLQPDRRVEVEVSGTR